MTRKDGSTRISAGAPEAGQGPARSSAYGAGERRRRQSAGHFCASYGPAGFVIDDLARGFIHDGGGRHCDAGGGNPQGLEHKPGEGGGGQALAEAPS